ncbi:MAG TPA: glycosyltransferase family 9 protein [Bryobacteraceae bacterium]|nr:glycosyltransferase family 9 protein [Bryobacteraceae bacterium]
MPRRLIIRPGAIGDFILTLPAMECLKTDDLEVWAASQNLPLVRFASRTRSIASTGLDMLEFSPYEPLIQQLRSFDSIISWYGANRPEFHEAVSRLGLPFQFQTAIPPDDCRVHAADFFAAQVCDAPAGPAIPRIGCPRGDEGFAVIHPFSGSPKKCWPLARYRELARHLEAHMPVRWCAGPEERLEGAVRIENLYDLACRLATARVYIGNDSGITHLAAAVGTPVVALFGPTDPRIWAPRGPHVTVIAGTALQEIAVGDVLAAVLRPPV